MMMKKQRGRRPSKPKGKGLLWCLRRNAKPKNIEKNQQVEEKKKIIIIKKKFQKVSKNVSNFKLYVF
jgi:hypothetical protein